MNISHTKKSKTKVRNVLGFDPGSGGGFGIAVLTDTADIVDTACISVKNVSRKSGRGEQLHPLMEALWCALHSMYDKYRFSHIFYERVARHSGVYAAHKYGAQIGLVHFFAHRNGVTYDGVTVQHAKVAMTGFYGAQKQHMVEAAKRLGYQGDNHNEADAIAMAIAGMQKHFLDKRFLE